jgi:hypothetical protein
VLVDRFDWSGLRHYIPRIVEFAQRQINDTYQFFEFTDGKQGKPMQAGVVPSTKP